MKCWAALALALAFAARADGPGHVIGTAPGKLVPSRPPLAGCSPLIPDDASTIFHFYVCGGAALDTKGNVLTEVGTVTRVAKTFFGFPNGKGAEGVTGFSLSNGFTTPAGLFNFSDNYWITFLIDSGPSQGISNKARPAFACYSGSFSSGNETGFYGPGFSNLGSVWTDNFFILHGSAGGSNLGEPNPINVPFNTKTILSYGQSGTTAFLKRDQTAATSPAVGGSSMTASTAVGKIGGGYVTPSPDNATMDGFPGTIFEIRVTRTVPTTALLDALHTAIVN